MTGHEGMNRRAFLRLLGLSGLSSGAALAGFVGASDLQSAPATPQFAYRAGRALGTTHVYRMAASSVTPTVARRIWEDDMIAVHQWDDRWALTDDGAIERHLLQPVLIEPRRAVTELPAFVEVWAGSAPVQAWCSPDAPLVTRIGHHGVLQAVDRLQIDSDDWLLVAGDGEPLGWSQSSFWSQGITSPVIPDLRVAVTASHSRQRLDVSLNDVPLFSMPATIAPHLTPGSYSVSRRRIEASYREPRRFGVPYVIDFDDYSMSGAYWHNSFGRPIHTPGSDIQVAPAAAQWLYQHLPERESISII